jgi:hypothetical protein
MLFAIAFGSRNSDVFFRARTPRSSSGRSRKGALQFIAALAEGRQLDA